MSPSYILFVQLVAFVFVLFVQLVAFVFVLFVSFCFVMPLKVFKVSALILAALYEVKQQNFLHL